MLAAHQTNNPSFSLGITKKANYIPPTRGENRTQSFFDSKRERIDTVVNALKKLYNGEPVRTPAIVGLINNETENTTRWLREAEVLGLCKNVKEGRYSLWLPMER